MADPIGDIEILLPSGYFLAASGDILPWFKEPHALTLVLHPDGSLSWREGTP